MKLFSFSLVFFSSALCGLVLAGCSDADWNHAMTYSGLGGRQLAESSALPGETSAPPPSQQQSSAPDNASFCQAVARQDSSRDNLDTATQTRVFERSFQQCIELFGSGGGASHGSVATR